MNINFLKKYSKVFNNKNILIFKFFTENENKPFKKIFKNKTEVNIEKESIDINQYLNDMKDFSSQFSKIKPLDLDRSLQKDEGEQKEIEKLQILLKTPRVREKGSEKLIDGLISIYKEISGIDFSDKGNNNSFDTYKKIVQYRQNSEIEEKLDKIFKSNDVIETLNIIIRHISDIKASGFEKLINLLVKIKYMNYEHWKIILNQYLLYLSILQTNYQALNNKHITQILSHLKDMYKYLPFDSNNDFLKVLDKTITESINHLFKHLDSMPPEYFALTINSVSKLGLLDEGNTKNIESILSDKLTDMPDQHFANLLFCIFKNRCASESLFKKLENTSKSILDNYKKNQINPFVVTMIAKSFYTGNRKNDIILKNIEELFLKGYDKYEIHQIIMIAFSLINLRTESPKFVKKVDEILLSYNNVNKLTELLTYQIISCFMKREGFSKENIFKYIGHYSYLIKNNQVKERNIFIIVSQLRNKTKNEKDPEILNFYKKSIEDFKLHGNTLKNM